MFSFGWKLVVSSLVDTSYNNLRTLIIGKEFSTQDLAFYNKGQNLPNFIVANVNATIETVSFSMMSLEQNDVAKIKKMAKMSIQTSTLFMFPMLMGLAICSKPLITLILTEKRLPCVRYLRIYCFVHAFWPIHTINLNAIISLGRSDIFLKLEIIKKIVGIIAILITVPIVIDAMAYSLFATTIASQIINAFPNKKLLNYGYIEQLKDISPQLLSTIIMGVFVYIVSLVKVNVVLLLIIEILSGIFVYIAICEILNIKIYKNIKNFILNKIKKS